MQSSWWVCKAVSEPAPCYLCSHPSCSSPCLLCFSSRAPCQPGSWFVVPYPCNTLFPYICMVCPFISVRFLLECNRSLPWSPSMNSNFCLPQILPFLLPSFSVLNSAINTLYLYMWICSFSVLPSWMEPPWMQDLICFCSLLYLAWCQVQTRNVCWTGEWMISLLNRWANMLNQGTMNLVWEGAASFPI